MSDASDLSGASYDHCACSLIGEQLAKQYIRLPSINDMHAGDGGQGIEAGSDFGDHAAANDAIGDKLSGLGFC